MPDKFNKHDINAEKIITTGFKRVRSRRPRATQRERQRMQMLNQAFDNLRIVVPRTHLADYQKLSKIATLRLAIQYIRAMKQTLGQTQSTTLIENEPDPLHYARVEDHVHGYDMNSDRSNYFNSNLMYYQYLNNKNKTHSLVNYRDSAYLFNSSINSNGLNPMDKMYSEKFSNFSMK